MNYDDLINKYTKSVDQLLEQHQLIKNHQDNHKNDFTVKNSSLKEEYLNQVNDLSSDISNINQVIKDNILGNSTAIKERFESYNNIVTNDDFEKHLKSLKKEHLSNKEELVKSINLAEKKTRQEHTYKINAYEREYSAKYKEYENEVSDLKKNYKNKKNEINRKLEFDIKKENDQAVRNSSPLDKELLVVNEPIQIKIISNEIKKIRAENLEKIFQIKRLSYEELEALETKFQLDLISSQQKIQILREQLNIKIAELNEKISIIKEEEKKKEDLLKLDFEKAVVEASKDNYLKLNETKRDYLTDVVNLKKLILEKNFINELNILTIITENHSNIQQKTIAQNEEINNLNDNLFNLEKDNILNVTNFIKSQINLIMDLAYQFVNEINNSFVLHNNFIYNNSIFKGLPDYSWESFDYQYNFGRFENNINLYKENQHKRLLNFQKEYNNQIKQLNNIIDNIIKMVIKFLENEIIQEKEFIKELVTHNDEILIIASEVYQNKKINVTSKYESSLKLLDSELEKITLDYENEKKVILANYDNDILKVNNKVKDIEINFNLECTKINENLKSSLQEINNKIKQISNTTKEKIEKSKKTLKEKYNAKHLENLEDKKEKVKLL